MYGVPEGTPVVHLFILRINSFARRLHHKAKKERDPPYILRFIIIKLIIIIFRTTQTSLEDVLINATRNLCMYADLTKLPIAKYKDIIITCKLFILQLLEYKL